MVNLKDLESFLKSFDLFGESFTFKIKKKKYYTSFIGGLTSFAFIIYSLYYFIYNLSDFFSKNIRTSENEIKMTNENSINLKDHQYLIFFFCFRDSKMRVDNFLTDNLQLEPFYIINKNNNSNFDSISKKLIPNKCTKEEFQNSFDNTYEYSEFNGCQCLNFTKNEYLQKNFELKSSNFFADKSFFRINIKKNSNSYNNTFNQANNDNSDSIPNYIKNHQDVNSDRNADFDVDQYLTKNESKLYIHFPSYFIEAKDLGEPLKKGIHTEIFKLKSQNNLESSLDFSLINFKDYSSLYDDGKYEHIFINIFFLIIF